MIRFIRTVAFFALVAGVFWFGRESTHGVRALWEHWWCPLPILMVVLGAATWLAAGRRSAA